MPASDISLAKIMASKIEPKYGGGIKDRNSSMMKMK